MPDPKETPGGADGVRPEPELKELEREYKRTIEQEKIPEEESRLAAAGFKTGPKGPYPEITSDFIIRCLNRNELGDAELYKAAFWNAFVFNKAMDQWMAWLLHHWGIDTMGYAAASVDGVAEIYAKEARRTAEKIREMTAKGDDPGHLETRYKMLRKRVDGLRSIRRRQNCLTFAHTSANAIAIEGSEIDQKPWLFPCANGVINLKTGELEPGRQCDYLIKASPVSWPDEGINAHSELWEKTLFEIFSGNTGLVEYFRRVCGYSMIGAVLLAVLFVLVGRGRNGKSLIVSILSKIAGPMAGAIRSDLLLDHHGTGNPAGPTPQLMTLRGLRMAFASELPDGCKISPAQVKWLTGNDMITARNPHDKYEVQFPPTHTLFLLTNHKPHAPADDFAFWERPKVIPFNVSFVNRPPKADYERQADPDLAEKLEKELPAILAWMVRGCLEFQQIGLDPPPAVKQAVQEYQRDEDLLGDFLENCCVVGTQYSVEFSQIFPAFVEWWDDNVGTKTPSKIWLAKILKQKGFEKTRGRTSKYHGLALLADDGLFSDRGLQP